MTDLDVRDVDLSRTRVRAAYLDGVRMTGVEVPDMEIYGEVVRLARQRRRRRAPRRGRAEPPDAGARADVADRPRRLPRRPSRRWTGCGPARSTTARALPPAALHEQVDEEWSFIETLRHLGFAHACWVGGVVLADPSPWHPLDLPWDQAPEVDGVPWDRDVRPSLDEVLELRAARRATVQAVLDDLDDAGLGRSVSSATPFLTDAEGLTVAQCLRVVLTEEWEHRLYAERDLAALGTRLTQMYLPVA